MNITLTGTKITQDNKFLAFEKNNGVDVINITVDTDESWTYKLDVKYPEKCCSGEALYNIINLTRNGNVCTAILTSDMLPFSGKYTMQIRGINGDKVTHSDVFDCWVKYSIEPASTYDPVPSEFYQIEANVTEMNNNPPYPSNDGYWMIWDVNTHAYKKSDIKIIDGLPEISESTKDMALYNDGEKAEWREQRNPIPDYQENDPESPNYIRNRNGGYYRWDEEKPIGKIMPRNKTILRFSDGGPNDQTPCYIEVTRGTSKTEFFKHFEYLYNSSGNADELGFSLGNWMAIYSGFNIIYAPSGADITDIKVYVATPVAFPLELTELQLATQITAGLVKVGNVFNIDEDIFGLTNTTMHLPEGKIEVPKPWVQVPRFEYSESGGMVPKNVAPAYVQNGFVVESSNYLAEILGIEATDFPIQIVGASTVYGSGIPYVPCQFFTKTGKSGYFDWRVNGKAENAVLNATGGDSDIFVVRFTQNNGTWSADKTYAEIKQALTDGKDVQGVVNAITAIAIDQLNVNQVEFIFNCVKPNVQEDNIQDVLVSVLDIIVTPDGTTGTFTGDYRSAIAPMQTILVMKNNDNYTSKLMGPIKDFDNPLTYIAKSMDSVMISCLSTLTVLFGEYDQGLPSRYYYSNVVITPNSATSSIKVDFIFKSADATKTLTGSVTMPNNWDTEAPLDETWAYIETDTLDGAVRYDETQLLTDAQKAQARDNIGVVDVPTPSAENVGKIPVSKQVGDSYKYVMEDKSTSDLSLGLTGTTVGQVPAVKTIDEQGKPTQWELVDMVGGGKKAWTKIIDADVTETTGSFRAEGLANVTEFDILWSNLQNASTLDSGLNVIINNIAVIGNGSAMIVSKSGSSKYGWTRLTYDGLFWHVQKSAGATYADNITADSTIYATYNLVRDVGAATTFVLDAPTMNDAPVSGKLEVWAR